MSALMTRRRRSPARDRDHDHGQASLFGQLVSPPPLAPRDSPARDDALRTPGELDSPRGPLDAPGELDAPVAGTADRSLEDAIAALWSDLVAGEAADCPVCGEAMEPRHSAGAGVVGGRCTSCATTIA